MRLLDFLTVACVQAIRILNAGADAGIERTEFVLEVELENGVALTTLSVIGRPVRFHAQASVSVTSLKEAVASSGRVNRKLSLRRPGES